MNVHKRFIGNKTAAARLWPFARKKLNEVLAHLRQSGGYSFTKTVSLGTSNWIRIQVTGKEAHVTINAGGETVGALGAADTHLFSINTAGRTLVRQDYDPLAPFRLARYPGRDFLVSFYEYDTPERQNDVRRVTPGLGEKWTYLLPRLDADSEFTGFVWEVAVDDEGNGALTVDTETGARKLTPEGEVAWQYTDFGQGQGTVTVYALAFDSAGNLFLAGELDDGTDHYGRLEKLAADGSFLWAHDDPPDPDGSGLDYFFSVTSDPDGAALIGRGDGALVKVAADGSFLWRTQPFDPADQVREVRTDETGALYATWNDLGRVRKYAGDGTLLWETEELFGSGRALAVQQPAQQEAKRAIYAGGFAGGLERNMVRLAADGQSVVWQRLTEDDVVEALTTARKGTRV